MASNLGQRGLYREATTHRTVQRLLLAHMDTKKLTQIENNIKLLLEEHPSLRALDKRREMIWLYWKTYDGLVFGVTKEMWIYGRVTWPDYLTRSLRKVMSKIKEVDNPERYKEGKLFSENYANKTKNG